ncbi:hypothetical protein Ple7327_1308 [Pleurocapsa sp. PCC 7327]|uniref:hypothetical protein n=1 Tax=Pleurocapsa sp. PCC 7327 TaxID=118163 RepID=UPI00029FD2E0|nr:hypothetical protein [Pleurocapsa sp. PCC 7327]AFY76701.1 hypothetical protein Ple7327_1308 [Pleurocapsa sp. PCC 7327]
MLKHYLYRSEQIPTAVHPFVKETTPRQSIQQVKSLPEQLLRGIKNLIARLLGFIPRQPMIQRFDRLQRMNRSELMRKFIYGKSTEHSMR